MGKSEFGDFFDGVEETRDFACTVLYGQTCTDEPRICGAEVFVSERGAMQAAAYRYVVFGIENIRRFRAGDIIERKRDDTRFVGDGIAFYAAHGF